MTSDNDPSRHILIEIKVSHGCTEKKKSSGAPIIEFDVESEEDVEYIISHDIEESDRVRFYGFKDTKQDTDNLIAPLHSLQKFTLYKSGKTYCGETNCQSFDHNRRSSLFELTAIVAKEELSKEDYMNLTLYGLMKAREREIVFPNCYLCEHYCYMKDGESNKWCEINDTAIKKGSDALKCKYYNFMPNAFERIKYLSFEVVDIWSRQDKV